MKFTEAVNYSSWQHACRCNLRTLCFVLQLNFLLIDFFWSNAFGEFTQFVRVRERTMKKVDLILCFV